jgi:tetratricopeptide (TPR) repeat protein
VVVALSALAAGALTIAAGLAVSDADHWPGWLRPYHRWGWPAVWVLLVSAAALAVWQATRQPGPPAGGAGPTVSGEDSGSVAARDVTVSGGQGPTAGRDAHLITGGPGQTAGRDIITIVSAPATSPDRLPVGDLQPPARPVSNLPPRNYAFTGRAELLDRLHQQLTATNVDAVAVTALPADPPAQATADADPLPRVLHGLGGVGKTHLALEYAHRHRDDYSVRWWVTAEQPAAIPGQLAALAHQLGIPEQPELAETVAALRAELGRRGGWLLVFDNAEDPRDLQPYWPSTEQGGCVLVTSRNPYWQPLAATLPVDVLPRQDAVAFLQRRVGLDKADADRLSEALGDLPLALEQAAAYLEQTRTPPDQYLGLLASRAWELLALGRPTTSEQTIATTWSVSLKRLHTEAPAAQDLLSLCAFLAPDDIPRTLLHDHPDLLPEPLATAVRDPLAYGQALGALGRYSLATVTGEAISVHRLVQAVVRDGLDAEHARTLAAAAIGLVYAGFPEQAEDVRAWPTAAQLLPHALVVADQAERLTVAPTASANLLSIAARYLWSRGEYSKAKVLLERAVRIRETSLGRDHPGTAKGLHDLANVLHYLGDTPVARTLHEHALGIREARLGENHPDTAHSLNNLGNVLREQGDLDRARALHERALSIREARLGAHHPHVAASLHNLGNVLHDQGDLEGARTVLERALAIREDRLGTDHPDTASIVGSLAVVVGDQGDLQGARALFERALTIDEAALGPDHPLTATILNHLAGALHKQGDLDQARALYERALRIREARLGADHPDTVRSRQDLAAVVAALDTQS